MEFSSRMKWMRKVSSSSNITIYRSDLRCTTRKFSLLFLEGDTVSWKV
ncbi:hypothetical protein HF086_014204 [Spodoptera exigua]|uniref:Uncharacterized protein n=1 Tax=Spodoptera exigua TaxID=7107 RepID=A0A922SHP5_SPOEX|nr:hypothetical protein HF086_014204 [Spodoptera exigua]